MPTRSSVAELLASLSTVLLRWGNEWFVFGAQAVMVYGNPRMTFDVDVTVKLQPEEPLRFAEEMKAAGFVLRVEDAEEFVKKARVMPFFHLPTSLPLDLVLAQSGLEDQFLLRAVHKDLGGHVVPVISPEDLVIAKVLAGRPKDLEDVRTLARVQAQDLDLNRVRDVLRQLEEALGEGDFTSTFETLVKASRNRKGR